MKSAALHRFSSFLNLSFPEVVWKSTTVPSSPGQKTHYHDTSDGSPQNTSDIARMRWSVKGIQTRSLSTWKEVDVEEVLRVEKRAALRRWIRSLEEEIERLQRRIVSLRVGIMERKAESDGEEGIRWMHELDLVRFVIVERAEV